MTRRSFRRDCRGQVIIVSALLVALILLSTAIYVIDVQKDVPTVEANNDGGSFDSYRASVKSAVISALANASGGGNPSILASDLEELKAVLLTHSYHAFLTMDYSLLDSGVYVAGVWVSWGNSGEGVSSAYVTVGFSSSSSSGGSEVDYTVNVTSRVHVSGGYLQLNDTHKQANLTVKVYSEAGPALADDFVFSYRNGTDWATVDLPAIDDSGDGTYLVSFTVESGGIGESLDVSTVCLDARGISVGANLTCSRVT